MTDAARIKGRIIRILGLDQFIINVGSQKGVRPKMVFNILGEPEAVYDPFTNEELGRVNVVKGKVEASRVYDRFAIVVPHVDMSSLLRGLRGVTLTGTITPTPTHGLTVDKDDIDPWRAVGEEPVRLGDTVEAVQSAAAPTSSESEPPKEG